MPAHAQDNEATDWQISRMPKYPERDRLLEVGVGDNAKMRSVAWTAGADKTSAFSRFSMTLAHELLRGGTIQIRNPGQNGGPSL